MSAATGRREEAGTPSGRARPGSRRGIGAVAAAVAASVVACSSLGLVGFGDATVLVTGDGGEASSVISGSLDVGVQVYLRGVDGFWSEVTSGERPLTLPISGGGFEELVAARVREGLYHEIRVVFHSVAADVTEGLEIDGSPVTGRVRVSPDGPAEGPVTVQRDLGVFVDERQPVEITIDLNSAAWLAATDPAGLQVTAEAFRNAVLLASRGVPLEEP